MSFRGDDRGQALQVGAVLLLAIAVIAIAGYQAQVVPQQNKEVEFDHNRQAQDDLADVRQAIVSVPGGNSGRSTSVQLGTTYPPRSIFVNPPPPTGELATRPPATVTVDGAVAVDEETADFWNGSRRSVSTRAMVYRPNYHAYTNPPVTAYENTVAFNNFSSARETRTLAEQLIVRDRRITLVALSGTYSRTGIEAATVDVEAVSTSDRVVTVRNASDQPLVLSIPTTIPNATWTELLRPEYESNGGYIVDQSYDTTVPGPSNRLNLTLKNETTYELRMAKVGVGSGYDETGGVYLTDVEGDNATVAENGTTTLTVEARDRFNNPVSDVSLNFSTARPDSAVSADSNVTDAEGHVEITYEAPADITGVRSVSDRINVSTVVAATNDSGFDSTTPENVSLNVMVSNADGSGVGGGGGGGGINPNSSGGVVLRDANIIKKSCKSNKNCQVDITLENLDPNTTREIDKARFNFYSIDCQGASGSPCRTPPELVEVNGTDVLRSANSGGRLKDITDIRIQNGSTKTFPIKFYQNNLNSPFEVQEGDFFVFSVVFANGESATYFVAPTN